ncbi:hypothetical protein [Ramlibacter sp. AN1133]|uniref:hypothetical protein n=1 Tax=Ramlibacter sp. AN1133 TaxID=3133429 RepID=UPI0030BDF827
MKIACAIVALLGALLPAAAGADFIVSGAVMEGKNFNTGIYNVLVEVVKGERVVTNGRTSEKGTFSLKVPAGVPFTGVVRYSKPGYKDFPTQMPLQVKATSVALSRVFLVSDDTTDEDMVQLAELLLKDKKGGNEQEVKGLIPALVALPASRKALVIEHLRNKDKDLYTMVAQANLAQAAADDLQVQLRKKDPIALVWPDYSAAGKDKFLVYNTPSSGAEPRITLQPRNAVMHFNKGGNAGAGGQ